MDVFWGTHRCWPTSSVVNPTRPSFLMAPTQFGQVGSLKLVLFRLGNYSDARTNGGGDAGVLRGVDGPRKREEMAHLGISTRLLGMQGI